MHTLTENQQEVFDQLGISQGTSRVFILQDDLEEKLREAGGQEAIDALDRDLMNGMRHDQVEIFFISEDDEPAQIVMSQFE